MRMLTRMLKYPLSITETTVIIMRAGSIVRAVDVQASRSISLWAEVPGPGIRADIARTFRVIATGGDMPAASTYIGTVMDDPFVWHVYEVRS